MAARILDGKSLAAAMRAALKHKVEALAQRGVRPGLAVILAGDDPASQGLRAQQDARLRGDRRALRSCSTIPRRCLGSELLDRVAQLNADRAVHGILVQLPLPQHIDAARVLEAIAPAKDVDGFHEANLGALLAGRPGVVPCTPAGVMRLLEHAGMPLAGRHAVVIGRSNIVGKPLAHAALAKGRHRHHLPLEDARI